MCHQLSRTSFFLILLLTCVYIPLPALAEPLRIGGSGTNLATMQLLGEAFSERNAGITISIPPSLGSGGGIKALIAGQLDLALTSRPLKSKEQQHPLRAYHYARTPLVFAVAKSNPVDSITTSQLQKIYSGEHPYWPDNSVAKPVLRPTNDSDTLMLKRYLPLLNSAMEQAYTRRGLPVAISDQQGADQLETLNGAIGTSTLALILAENRNLKALKLNGVEPSPSSIKAGQYLMVKDLYIVIADSSPDTARRFIDFLRSETAQQILHQTGHHAIEIK